MSDLSARVLTMMLFYFIKVFACFVVYLVLGKILLTGHCAYCPLPLTRGMSSWPFPFSGYADCWAFPLNLLFMGKKLVLDTLCAL